MVRPLQDEDWPEWLRLRQALWPDCAEAMHRHEMAERASAAAAVFVHARGDGRLGGFVEVSVRGRVDGSFAPRVAYVEGWYVDADLRGRQIGRRLIEQAGAWAQSLGLTELASDAEWGHESALRAHRALGFSETFRLVHFLKKL